MKAWGFMMTMVIPTLSIKNFSDMMDHPDVFLDTVKILNILYIVFILSSQHQYRFISKYINFF